MSYASLSAALWQEHPGLADTFYRLARLFALGLVFILPLEAITAAREIAVVGMLLFLALFFWARHEFSFRSTVLFWPLIFYVAATVFSLFTAVDMSYTLKELRAEVLKGLLLFYAGVHLIQDEENLKQFWGVILVGLAVDDRGRADIVFPRRRVSAQPCGAGGLVAQRLRHVGHLPGVGVALSAVGSLVVAPARGQVALAGLCPGHRPAGLRHLQPGRLAGHAPAGRAVPGGAHPPPLARFAAGRPGRPVDRRAYVRGPGFASRRALGPSDDQPAEDRGHRRRPAYPVGGTPTSR